jgi:hypothetical protein
MEISQEKLSVENGQVYDQEYQEPEQKVIRIKLNQPLFGTKQKEQDPSLRDLSEERKLRPVPHVSSSNIEDIIQS